MMKKTLAIISTLQYTPSHRLTLLTEYEQVSLHFNLNKETSDTQQDT